MYTDTDTDTEDILMPVQRGSDSNGPYYRWGDSGKKYYYTSNSVTSRENAKDKARRQGAAIKISQGRR